MLKTTSLYLTSRITPTLLQQVVFAYDRFDCNPLYASLHPLGQSVIINASLLYYAWVCGCVKLYPINMFLQMVVCYDRFDCNPLYASLHPLGQFVIINASLLYYAWVCGCVYISYLTRYVMVDQYIPMSS